MLKPAQHSQVLAGCGNLVPILECRDTKSPQPSPLLRSEIDPPTPYILSPISCLDNFSEPVLSEILCVLTYSVSPH
jgi:hypothetical protein